MKYFSFNRFEPNYLLDIVLGIQCKKEPDSIQNLTKIKVCIYIDALINFVSELGEKRRNKDMKHQSFSKISEKVESNIRDLFSIPDSIKLWVRMVNICGFLEKKIKT